MGFNHRVGTAKIRRLAERAHAGQLFVSGGLFTDHLARVVELVEQYGGSLAQIQAAWLYAVPATGVGAVDLLRRGVSVRVVEMVDLLQRDHDPSRNGISQWPRRDRRAALVRYAVLTDWHRHLSGPDRFGYTSYEHISLADTLSLPRPAAPPPPAAVEIGELVSWRPGAGEHWGPVVRRLQAARGPQALPALLAAYAETVDRGPACCLAEIRSAVYTLVGTPANVPSEQLLDLSRRWWSSTTVWEERVAIKARTASRVPADRTALCAKLGSGDQWVVVAAIEALTGPGDQTEIEALRRIVTKPEPTWQWAHRAAAGRLTRIGGPDAARALEERYLNPMAPPWAGYPEWLNRHEATIVPVLIDKLADPRWQAAAPAALAHLRTAQAVGPLCAGLPTTAFKLAYMDALGRIGDVRAVPALLEQTRHPRHDIRDHALRALAHLDDPRVVDAAIAACDDLHPVVRDRAARILVRHPDERAVPQLLRLCDGPHAARAAAALIHCADERALPTLWHLFFCAPGRQTRHAAGRALARIDGPRRYPPNPDIRVKRAYIWLLGFKPQWQPAGTLRQGLDDTDPIVRARAVQALARLGDTASTPTIRGLLTDPDRRVRAAAATALRTAGSPSA